MSTRVLMITTSTSLMGRTNQPTGLWAEELAVPYYALADAGIRVLIASTQGGKAPIDPGSMKAAGMNSPAVERMLADPDLQSSINHTHPVSELDAADFDAVFFPGGHGTMWDLPDDPGVKSMVESALGCSKPVAAVCHGVAGLLSARRADGLPMVHGKRINSFTDAEEREAGLAGVVPFLLETRLRELGGCFENANNWQAFAVQDGPLITGQNPQSSALVVAILLESLGIKN